ncbi:tyrosine-type recombinase/integrase [Jeongeupia chitinilytica]|uniref:Integrase n=1 Tax=Jeongeupia chitinilytica TaxID=1041641 RepID=A0ABQ3GY89_9NEIS|nr:site-specific integrase [Jeongeupia chitinilytica]GHD60302.1 integrase [Jeongeupia chitinilytica]
MGGKWPGVNAVSETSIEITFSYRGVRCRERIKLQPTPANLKRVAQHRAAVLEAIALGTFDYTVTFPDSARARMFAERLGQVETVEDYLCAWFDQQSLTLKASTLHDYRMTIFNHLIPAFGSMRLSDLKRPVIRNWCNTLTAGNKRIANMLSPLRIALNDAVDDEMIESNPLHDWTYRRKTAPRRVDDVDPLSPSEQASVLANLEGAARNLVQFAFWTGLRTSELIALEWKDIDWIRSVVMINKAKTAHAKEPETPKTRAGAREVKLLPMALQALEAQKVHTLEHPSGLIWLNPYSNQPWKGPNGIRKSIWLPALERAGVRYRRPYQTRHTYASMMLSAGEAPMWVAAQMGHADWTMIARVYGRWLPDASPQAGLKANATFGRNALVADSS